MTTTVRRVSRRLRFCESCGGSIGRGDVYLRHKSFPGPGDDAGYATAAGHPVEMAECAKCATRYGRIYELDDIPWEQCARQGLL